MIRFNDSHIFVGQIKQMLKDFNLPRYRAGKWQGIDAPGYFFGKRVRNYTRNLQIKTNSYDSYTHEHLGWYLRFYRDYIGIDLMPLYNCFSERVCDNLNVKAETGESGLATFDSDDKEYKIFSLPIQIGRKYTIAIESHMPVEVCCVIFGFYQSENQRGIPSKTYKKYNTMTFSSPEVFDTSSIADLDLGAEEANVKMLIKMPISNESSVVVLEGDYSGWQSELLTQKKGASGKYAWASISNKSAVNFADEDLLISSSEAEDETNEGITTKRWRDSEEVNPSQEAGGKCFTPITPLQLLKINTGITYPFADRLIEYLVGNVITPEDELHDNVTRAQRVMSMHHVGRDKISFEEEGLWESKMRALAYVAMQNDATNGNDKNHDILGYIDKDVESQFSADVVTRVMENGRWTLKTVRHTILSEDIYDTMYIDDQEG